VVKAGVQRPAHAPGRCQTGNLLLVAAGLVDHGGDEALADLDLGVLSNAHDETVVLHVGDRAIDAAARDDFVTGAQRREHLLLLLLFLPLRGDHEEIHRGKQQDVEDDHRAAAGAGRCSCLGKNCGRVGDEGHFRHCVLRVLKKENMHPNGFPLGHSKP